MIWGLPWHLVFVGVVTGGLMAAWLMEWWYRLLDRFIPPRER